VHLANCAAPQNARNVYTKEILSRLVIVADSSVTTFRCFSVFLRQKQMFGRLRRLN